MIGYRGHESKRRWNLTVGSPHGVTVQMKVASLQREHGFGVGHVSSISDELSLRHARRRSRDLS